MWFYIGHLYGGIYATDEQQDFADLYCEECGDSDWEIGEFNSADEFIKYMTDSDNFLYEGYERGYLDDVAKEYFG